MSAGFAVAVLTEPRVGASQLDAGRPELQKAFETLAGQLSDGIAEFDTARVAAGKPGSRFHDKVVALIFLTSWAGGNGSRQFLAVFEHHPSDPHDPPIDDRLVPLQLLGVVPVGEDFRRMLQSVELQDDEILLQGLSWLKSDAHCCPTVPVRVIYRFDERGLVEITR